MLGIFFQGGGKLKQVGDQAHVHQIGDVGFALGDGSCFIQHHRADGMGDLQGFR